MKSVYYNLRTVTYLFTTSLLLILGLDVKAQSDDQVSVAHFSLDDCSAYSPAATQVYSEFTASIENGSNCSTLEILGGNLYRNDPKENPHSCTPGVDDTRGMCFGADPSCEYNPGSGQSLRIDVRVTPGESGTGALSRLYFYEQGPDTYNWTSGGTGENNYPTLFAVRVLKNGDEIYSSSGNATSSEWTLRSFMFNSADFTVNEPTTFKIELLAYCPVGNGGLVSAWDIDEISIYSDCIISGLDGGTLSGGPFEFCVGDGIVDNVSGVSLTGNAGTNSQYVVTDEAGTILGLPPSPEAVDFDGAGNGVCLIWHLSYEDTLTGLELNNNVSDLMGQFDFSNSITVVRNQPEGGTLEGGPFDFCVGDGIGDHVSGVALSGNVGPNSAWVVTDPEGNILGLPPSAEAVDFDGAGAGVCLIWHLSYADGLTGLELDGNAADLSGCFSLSNSITVNRNEVAGGTLEGGPFGFCVGDDVPDHISGIVLSGNIGPNSQWVVTDPEGNILGLPPHPDSVNFDGAGIGTCLIWHLSYADGLTGLELGINVSALSGCFSFSNEVTVVRDQPEGGTLTGGPFDFCVGDGVADMVSGVSVTGNVGANSQWVVTDTNGTILGLPPSPDSVDFDGAGAGVCLIWHLSYADGITGLELGSNAADLVGCFSLSNPVTVNRNEVAGGTLEGGPFGFCVGDDVADHVSGIVLSGNVGPNSQWVVTDTSGNILGLPPHPDSVNFDGAGTGICLIWHLSYADGLSGLELGNNVSSLIGCFSFSNEVTVVRDQPVGGILSGGPFEFCVGDGVADMVSGVTVTGNVGASSQWVVTDTLGTILGLPPAPDSVDFDGAGNGVCLIWHLSYADGIMGLELGANAADLVGCFSLSDAITVIRNEVSGGTLQGGPFDFCVGNGMPDMVSGVTLSGNVGPNSQWVVTDTSGNILGLPPAPDSVDFDGAGDGICLIWHLSYADGLDGLELEANTSDLSGCFSLSNPVTVRRNQPEGGTISGGPFEFCVGDDVADMVSGVSVTGNVGANSRWVVTDTLGTILGLPPAPDSVDFDGAGNGVCLIWHLSYGDGLTGLELGANAADLMGCFSLSNPITVTRNGVSGGTLTGGPFEFCVGDGTPDMVSGVMVTGNVGPNSQYVVTDTNGTILGLPPSPDSVDFDGAGNGVCLIWHLSYADGLSGLELGANASSLSGCFSLSNPVTVVRNQPAGGTLTGGSFEFCVGDGTADMVSGVSVSGAIGPNSQYVVTDTNGVILGLPGLPEEVDFDGAGEGVCLIWHLSYGDGLTGLEMGANTVDLSGCFSFSNAVVVNRVTEGESCGGMTSPAMIVLNEINVEFGIEVKNVGGMAMDISSLWLCRFPDYIQFSDMSITCQGGDLTLEPGEVVVFSLPWSINTADDEMAIYSSNSFGSSSAIVDYVEWGTSGHQRSSVAQSAGIWSSGAFVPAFSPSNSILYDGDGDTPEDWSEGMGSPCADNSAPARATMEFEIYPNPATSFIRVKMQEESSIVTIQLIDVYGTIVMEKRNSVMSSEGIDISELGAGHYFMRMVSDSGIATRAFSILQ